MEILERPHSRSDRGFAGSRILQVRDELNNLSFPLWVLYPTRVPSQPVSFGPYTIDVSPDAPVEAGPFPLAVISHGSGGSHLLYRTLAAHLAKNGYIVVLPEHPGDNRTHRELFDTIANAVNRPRHLTLSMDAVYTDAAFKNSLLADNAAVIGHSMGGYTALALAGGTPWSKDRQKIEVTADGRVKALVLMAPVAGWFLAEGSLRSVTVPILLLAAEHDTLTPPWNGEVVLAGVPDPAQVTYRMIPNAGHFSFLSPFSPPMKRADFPPSMDPEGFDRQQYHLQLNSEVLAFLDAVLKPS
jgi:predicted dienelactone hydrolase